MTTSESGSGQNKQRPGQN